MSQDFFDGAIRSFEPLLLSQMDEFPAQLRSGSPDNNVQSSGRKQRAWSKLFNMTIWCKHRARCHDMNSLPDIALAEYLFFDLITNIVFGRTYDFLGSNENRFITKAIQHSNVRMSTLAQWPAILWRRTDKKMFSKFMKARDQFLRFMMRISKERMGVEKNLDVYSLLHKSKDPETGKALSQQELGAERTTISVAGMSLFCDLQTQRKQLRYIKGSYTSSCLMATMYIYMTRNPEAYERVAQEGRTALKTLALDLGSSRAPICANAWMNAYASPHRSTVLHGGPCPKKAFSSTITSFLVTLRSA